MKEVLTSYSYENGPRFALVSSRCESLVENEVVMCAVKVTRVHCKQNRLTRDGCINCAFCKNEVSEYRKEQILSRIEKTLKQRYCPIAKLTCQGRTCICLQEHEGKLKCIMTGYEVDIPIDKEE